MKVYSYDIEVFLDPACEEAQARSRFETDKIAPSRNVYFAASKEVPEGVTTQERALIQLFWTRACREYKLARETGYIGSYHNCALELLHGIYGVDILAYLFDQCWVPTTVVDPFRPNAYLSRLRVLEQASHRLRHGTKLPVTLRGASAYAVVGMGEELKRFDEVRHRFLLDRSLAELHAFGELGAEFTRRSKPQKVHIQIWTPYGFNDSECNHFKALPDDWEDPVDYKIDARDLK
jgi:hypothetical protein